MFIGEIWIFIKKIKNKSNRQEEGDAHAMQWIRKLRQDFCHEYMTSWETDWYLLPNLKIQGRSEAQFNSQCLTWSKMYLPGTWHNVRTKKKKKARNIGPLLIPAFGIPSQCDWWVSGHSGASWLYRATFQTSKATKKNLVFTNKHIIKKQKGSKQTYHWLAVVSTEWYVM